MSPKRLILCLLVSAALLAACLWLADAVLQPIPMPLGGAAVLGWLGFWACVRGRPLRGLAIGFAIGAIAGVVMHVRSHIVEDRVESAGSLAVHVVGDLGLSSLGAALTLAASVGWTRALRRAPARTM